VKTLGLLPLPKASALLSSNRASVSLLLSWLLSVLQCLVQVPDMFFGRVSPLAFQDLEFIYLGSSVQSWNLVSGGFNFWNPFDSVDLSYLYLSGGMSYSATIPGVISGTLESIGVSFAPASVIFPVYFALVIGVRVVGTCVLASQFSKNPVVIFLTTTVTSFAFSSPTFLGLNTSGLVALLPISLALMMKAVQQPSNRTIAMFMVLISATIASDPLIALGYHFVPIHLTAIGSLMIVLVSPSLRSCWKIWLQRVWNGRKQKHTLARASLIIGLCLGLNIPWVRMTTWMFSNTETSSARAESGFGLSNYLQSSHFGIASNPSDNFTRLHTFTTAPYSNTWWNSWPFIGSLVIVLAALGMVLGNDRRRWISLFSLVMLFFLQLPRQGIGLFSFAHQIVGLTNPFSFLLRSLQMPAAMWGPFLIIPLLAIGLDSLLSRMRANGVRRTIYVVVSLWLLSKGTLSARYSMASSLANTGWWVSFVSVYVIWFLARSEVACRKVLVGSLLVASLSFSFILSSIYVRNELRMINEFSQRLTPSLASARDLMKPSYEIDLSGGNVNDAYLASDPIGMRGILTATNEVGKYLSPPRDYRPRSKVWRSLSLKDLAIAESDIAEKVPYVETVGNQARTRITRDSRVISREWIGVDTELLKLKPLGHSTVVTIRRPFSKNLSVFVDDRSVDARHLKGMIEVLVPSNAREIRIAYTTPFLLRYGVPASLFFSTMILFGVSVYSFRIEVRSSKRSFPTDQRT